jgi:hypothetical protein
VGPTCTVEEAEWGLTCPAEESVKPSRAVEEAEWGLPALLRRQSGAYLHC